MKIKRNISIISIVTCIILLIFNFTVFAKNTYEKGKVVRVIDGDTIIVNISNKEYKVRMIGVNTPESTIKIEPYGKEASSYTKKCLLIK